VKTHVAAAVLVAVLAGCAREQKSQALANMPLGAPVEQVRVAARPFEFAPNIVRFTQGAHAVMEIESQEEMKGFSIDRLGIYVDAPAKKTVIVEFYAERLGSTPFYCVRFAGEKRPEMRGTIVVEAPRTER
jgi:hypothetical protein